jgi:hypothetical protein
LSQVRATALLVTFVTDGAGQALGFVARWAASLATRAPSFRATGASRAQPCGPRPLVSPLPAASSAPVVFRR